MVFFFILSAVNFTKRHEVRQVYVRSTARVYEIYITPKVQGDNEYLCTVRCGIAAKEDEIPDVALSNEDGSPCLGESKHSNDEEWVEVKVPNASAARNGVSTVAVNPCMDMVICRFKFFQLLFLSCFPGIIDLIVPGTSLGRYSTSSLKFGTSS